MDASDDNSVVVVRLARSDAAVLWEVLVALLHPSTGITPRERAAVLSIACQLRRVVKDKSEPRPCR